METKEMVHKLVKAGNVVTVYKNERDGKGKRKITRINARPNKGR